MALIYCYNCGKQVSDRATRCPHCGSSMLPVGDTKKHDGTHYSTNEPSKRGGGNIVLIALILLFAVTFLLVGVLIYNNHQEIAVQNERADSVAVVVEQLADSTVTAEVITSVEVESI